MTIDLNRYRRNIKPIIEAFVTREPTADKNELIGRIALATTCPIIAVCYYMSELYGMSPELKAFIGRLVDFYKVDTILGEEIQA